MAELDSTLRTKVAHHAAAAMTQPLSAELREKVGLHLLDTLAAIVSGAVLEAGIAAQRYAESFGGPPIAAILGMGLRVPLTEAALANGMAAHADESDDSHEDSQTHPGCGAVPAVIITAECLDRSGEELLRAVMPGYEMTIRFASAPGSAMTFLRSLLSSHAYGPVGAGYATGALTGFDQEQFATLLNYPGPGGVGPDHLAARSPPYAEKLRACRYAGDERLQGRCAGAKWPHRRRRCARRQRSNMVCSLRRRSEQWRRSAPPRDSWNTRLRWS